MPLPLLGLGSILSMGSRIVPAAVRGYRTYQKARQVGGLGRFAKSAQPPVKGFPLGYEGTAAQRLLGQQGAGLGGGTGLQGLMARGAKRFPGTTGGSEVLFGVGLGGEGTADFVQGYQQGDVPQMLSGIGSLAFGAPLLARGTRLLGAQRTLKKAMPKTAEALRLTGKGVGQRIPKGTGYVGLGAIGAGAVGEAAGFGTPDQEPKVLGNPVEIVLKAIEEDKANPDVDTTTNEYKQIATQILTDAYQQAQKQGIEMEQDLTQLTSPYIIKSEAQGSNSQKPNEANLITKGLADNDQMTDGEIAAVAKKQENTMKAGEKIKDDVLTKANAAEAEQFNAFYNRLKNVTGGNDNTNNLILMKLASGLISGKTGQTGFRGFLDVLGQAGNETVDTAMALYQKEADRRSDLAVQYLKSKEKNTKGRPVTGSRKRVNVSVSNEESPFGMATRTVDYFKDDGTTAMFVPEYAADGKTVIGEIAVPMPYGDQKPIQGSAAQEAKLRTQLDNVGLAYQMTQQILEMPDSAFGIGPKLLGFSEDAIGSIESIANTFGLNMGGYSPNTDATIIQEIINAPVFSANGEERQLTKEESEELAEITQQYKKEIDGILSKFRPGEEQLDQITKAKLIQTRLKYIVANANKAEDRLTQKDIENAEESTQILGWKSAKAVRSAYTNLQSQLDKQFEGIGRRYISSGGSNKYVLEYFTHMPFIANWIEQRNKEATNKAVQNNVQNVISGIQM